MRPRVRFGGEILRALRQSLVHDHQPALDIGHKQRYLSAVFAAAAAPDEILRPVRIQNNRGDAADAEFTAAAGPAPGRSLMWKVPHGLSGRNKILRALRNTPLAEKKGIDI